MPRPPLASVSRRRRAAGLATRTAGAAALLALVAIGAAACRGGEEPAAAASAVPRIVETPPAQPAASDGAPRLAEGPAAATPPPAPATPTPAPPAAPSTPSAGPGSPGQTLAELESRLDHMISDAASCTGDGECRSVAVGGKACGGPTGFRAYSANGADPKAVEDLASRERELATAEARASGRVSNCLMLADPGARCDQGRCVTGGPSARSPATR
jgi:hypothetical protein